MAFSYQGGLCFEVFSPQGSKPLPFKVACSKGVRREYDKGLRGTVVAIDGVTTQTKVQLPRDDKASLQLTQPYLVLQLYALSGQPLYLEFIVTDMECTGKWRLIFSSSVRDTNHAAHHTKLPLNGIVCDKWLNLCFHMPQLIYDNFKQLMLRTTDTIIVGPCRIRKIFTLRDIREGIPLCMDFPPGSDSQSLIFCTNPSVEALSPSVGALRSPPLPPCIPGWVARPTPNPTCLSPTSAASAHPSSATSSEAVSTPLTSETYSTGSRTGGSPVKGSYHPAGGGSQPSSTRGTSLQGTPVKAAAAAHRLHGLAHRSHHLSSAAAEGQGSGQQQQRGRARSRSCSVPRNSSAAGEEEEEDGMSPEFGVNGSPQPIQNSARGDPVGSSRRRQLSPTKASAAGNCAGGSSSTPSVAPSTGGSNSIPPAGAGTPSSQHSWGCDPSPATATPSPGSHPSHSSGAKKKGHRAHGGIPVGPAGFPETPALLASGTVGGRPHRLISLRIEEELRAETPYPEAHPQGGFCVLDAGWSREQHKKVKFSASTKQEDGSSWTHLLEDSCSANGGVSEEEFILPVSSDVNEDDAEANSAPVNLSTVSPFSSTIYPSRSTVALAHAAAAEAAKSLEGPVSSASPPQDPLRFPP
eukprot:RCo037864